MSDIVPLKAYLQANDATKVFDFEEEQISLTKFVTHQNKEYLLFYIEIDSRSSENIKKIEQEKYDRNLKLLKLNNFYWRAVTITYVKSLGELNRINMNVKICDGKGSFNEINIEKLVKS